jgi:L-ascorbate metabolism protein UlaG (beta-lactamase superfamily)
MSDLTLTRICHSCALIDIAGATVLTDPWFSERPTYHPGEAVAFAPEQLPPLAGVFVSHGHYDHCDLAPLAAYPDKSVPFAVKRGLGDKVRAAGFANVTELDPWESTRLGPVTVTAAPAKHLVPEITAVLQHSERTVFFGADTLYIAELAEVASRFPKIDLALVPINGLRIRPLLNRKVVMDAREAGYLTRTLSPAVAVPIHYAFTGGPLGDRVLVKHDGRPEAFLAAVAELAPDTEARVLDPGQPLRLQ